MDGLCDLQVSASPAPAQPPALPTTRTSQSIAKPSAQKLRSVLIRRVGIIRHDLDYLSVPQTTGAIVFESQATAEVYIGSDFFDHHLPTKVQDRAEKLL